jgi:uncharacterized protein YjcR
MPANKEGYYRKLRADEQLIYEQAQIIKAAKESKQKRMLEKIQFLEDRIMYLAKEFPEKEVSIASTKSDMMTKTTEFLNFNPTAK